MNVVVDWGNTRLKVGWFNENRLTDVERYATPDALLTALTETSDSGRQQPDQVLILSTNQPADDLRNRLAERGCVVRILDGQTPVPIGNGYETPQTLGADRVAAAVGATVLFPGQACLVLDLGTCLTADFVDAGARFRGGLIAPGLHMRLRAMHEQTARLPLLDWPPAPEAGTETAPNWPELTARTTRQAMLSGVLNGLAFELNGIVETYRQTWPNLRVLLCGGDAPTFESRLKPPIFAVPELVLIGLNRILTNNV